MLCIPILALATLVFGQQHFAGTGARVTDESLGISAPNMNTGTQFQGSLVSSESNIDPLGGFMQGGEGLPLDQGAFPGAAFHVLPGFDGLFARRDGQIIPAHIEIGPDGQIKPQFTNTFFATPKHVAHLAVQPPGASVPPPAQLGRRFGHVVHGVGVAVHDIDLAVHDTNVRVDGTERVAPARTEPRLVNGGVGVVLLG